MTSKKASLFFVAIIIFIIALFGVEVSLGRDFFGGTTKKQNLSISTNPLLPLNKLVATSSVKAKGSPSPTTAPIILGNQLRVPMLMYHYIGNNPDPRDKQRDSLSVSPDKFEEQMVYLASNGYSTTNLDTLYSSLKKVTTLPNKTIILTFDDGYIDFYHNAYPVLRRLNFQATVFIPTGLMNQGPYLNWSQIQEMKASGLISFQAHTVKHVYLPSLSDENALFELRESKKVLESYIGSAVNFLAYPFGATNDRIINLTKQAGFTGAIGTWPNYIQAEGYIYNMPRLRVGGFTSLQVFISYL